MKKPPQTLAYCRTPMELYRGPIPEALEAAGINAAVGAWLWMAYGDRPRGGYMRPWRIRLDELAHRMPIKQRRRNLALVALDAIAAADQSFTYTAIGAARGPGRPSARKLPESVIIIWGEFAAVHDFDIDRSVIDGQTTDDCKTIDGQLTDKLPSENKEKSDGKNNIISLPTVKNTHTNTPAANCAANSEQQPPSRSAAERAKRFRPPPGCGVTGYDARIVGQRLIPALERLAGELTGRQTREAWQHFGRIIERHSPEAVEAILKPENWAMHFDCQNPGFILDRIVSVLDGKPTPKTVRAVSQLEGAESAPRCQCGRLDILTYPELDGAILCPACADQRKYGQSKPADGA